MTRLASGIFAHWQLKLLSLVFAVALWVFLVVEDKGEAVYTVPLDVKNVPVGTEVVALGAEAIAVRVQGLRHVLSRIDERELHATVDLRGARPGDVLVRLRPEDITLPRGVEVVRITPAQVRATLDPITAGTRP